jgi:hypothetical protein
MIPSLRRAPASRMLKAGGAHATRDVEDSLGGVSISVFLNSTHWGHTTYLTEVSQYYTGAFPSSYLLAARRSTSSQLDRDVDPDEKKHQTVRNLPSYALPTLSAMRTSSSRIQEEKSTGNSDGCIRTANDLDPDRLGATLSTSSI